ncbi:MAG: HAMP domain-containing protein, partial [Deltaproteobacteria bacterium]
MFLILGFFACLIMRNALNNMQQLRVIQEDISELDLITRIHSGINRQLREGILYLVSLQPRALEGFRESGVVVKSSLAQWAKFTKSSGIIKDEEERLKAVKYIENKYNLVMQDFKQAFALAEFGHKQEALSLIKGNTEPGARIILFEEFEQEIGDQIDKFKDTHDNALLGMVFMPWVAGKNRDNLRFAREITRTFINIDRLNAAINRQAGEAIVYLIASDKEDKSEIIRPNPEIARLFREWRRDTQTGIGLSSKEAAQKLKDIETIETEYTESVTFLGQANALKASGDNEQMLGVLGQSLEPLLDDTLLVRISAASTEAKLAIALRHEKLFNSTFSSALQGVTVLLGIFILIILVYIKLIRGMIISLNKLEAGTKVIAKGDLEHWIDLKYKDELGELASSFNKMAQDLQKSKKEIVHARDYTEKILRSMNDALIVVSPPGEIQIVNTATCNLLGYKEEELVG